MKKFSLVIAVCWLLCGASVIQAAQDGPKVRLRDGKNIVVTVRGAATVLPQDVFPVMPVLNAAGVPSTKLFFCGVGAENGSPYGMAPGLYLFDARGAMAGFIPSDAAEFCAEVRLSPGGSILAMDSGSFLVRDWYFYTYPGLKALGSVEYFQAEEKPGLIWNGDVGVLFSSMDTAGHNRQCDYDPCGPVSVRAYFFKTRTTKILLPGTDLCDYTLAHFSPGDGVVAAEKLCLPSVDAWKNFPEHAPVESTSVNLGTFNP